MKYRFQDNTLPFEERAKDLLSRLTREEKVGMITSQLDDIPRLGIKKTHIGTEIARGVVNRDQKRETTILPQPWGMAAMFDDALMEQLGDMARRRNAHHARYGRKTVLSGAFRTDHRYGA